jgi:DNA-directed RNA polymerase specialized sigma subunit
MVVTPELSILESGQTSTPADEYLLAERIAEVQQALRTLTREEQFVLSAKLEAKMTWQNIAMTLKITAAQARRLHVRSIDKLRTTLRRVD